MGRRRDDEELFRPSNPLSFSEQLTEGAAQANPLMMGRPGIREQYAEPATVPALEGISPEVAAANPLIRPPRPIKYMPVEQQIIWQDMQAEALGKQAALQNQLHNSKKAATEAKLDLARKAQSSAIFDALGDLDPTQDDYQDRRDKVLSANPIGAASEEVRNLFTYKDKAWDVRQNIAIDNRKRALDTQEALRKEAVTQARKDAVEIGDPTLLEEVSRLSAEDPDRAVARVAQVKSRLAQANIVTQLQQYGVPPEEIQSLYRDPATGIFRADAAAARIKVEESKRAAGEKVASESQIADIVTNLNKQKAEGTSATAAVEGKTWTPEDQALLDAYRKRLSIFATEPAPGVAPPMTRDEQIRASNEAVLRKLTATGPKGEKMIWKNGKWTPL